jgi:D-beta-D-heptose 7-phosphate kinase/D-beta-D-heptose 1-phosphate adenosyltransferase
MLEEWRCDVSGVIRSDARPSTSKVRLVGLAQHRHPQQMMRLDYEDASPIGGALAEQVIEAARGALAGAEALCLEDYNKGLLPPAVCQAIIAAAREAGVPVFVDPAAIQDYSKYAGASVVTPNATETALATGMRVTSEEEFDAAATHLVRALNLDAALLTLDKRGSYLATRDGQRRWLKTRERTVYDVSGAGDMVLAMVAAARASGASWAEAAALGNVAGGLEVERFGSVPVTRDEIVEELLLEARQHLGKQRTTEQLVPELMRHRAAGKRIVFTNGCFDLIHLGHVKYFQYAKRQGDLLVVAVNTDHSIRRLKGNKRPIINEQDRIGVLEELESIDYLVRFDTDTPLELIHAIRPDVLVKGADYAKEQVVGWDFVESCGGSVALAPLVDGKSTSAVIERILEAYR